jgi:hypothetical protein
MRYVRVFTAGDGSSKFEDLEMKGVATRIVAGMPPLLISSPLPVGALLFVEPPEAATGWEAHVAPRPHWVILLSGRVEVVTSDGERREFHPGAVALFEDTTGKGHLATPLTDDVRWAMMPVAASGATGA